MRHRWIALISMVLAGTLLPSNAQASVKPGTVCPKLNATIISIGSKYTCIKSGKKLVWNKGVIQPTKTVGIPITPSPAPTPTPLPSSSSTPIQTGPTAYVEPCLTSNSSKRTTGTLEPIDSEIPGIGPAGRFVYRYVDEKLQRKNAQGIWMSGDDRCANLFDPIRVSAFNSIQNIVRDESLSNVTIVDHFAENFPKVIASSIKAQVIDFFRIMSPYLD